MNFDDGAPAHGIVARAICSDRISDEVWSGADGRMRLFHEFMGCDGKSSDISKTEKSVHGNTSPCKDDNAYHGHLLGGTLFQPR